MRKGARKRPVSLRAEQLVGRAQAAKHKAADLAGAAVTAEAFVAQAEAVARKAARAAATEAEAAVRHAAAAQAHADRVIAATDAVIAAERVLRKQGWDARMGITGGELCGLRFALQVSQGDLAAILGMSAGTLRIWERNPGKTIGGAAGRVLGTLYRQSSPAGGADQGTGGRPGAIHDAHGAAGEIAD
jgi:DNA-binding transcriptional regulator YiaG